MKEIEQLLNVIDRLLGPGGCPWDQKQTLVTTQAPLLEEVYELNEAIDLNDNLKIVDELGDLLFNVLFCCRLGEKESRFTTQDVLKGVIDKLIRRHPHVFGETSINNVEEVLTQWEQIKKGETTHQDRKSSLDGIPRGLPSLARAQKILKKISKTDYSYKPKEDLSKAKQSIGQELLELVSKAQSQGIDAELALREEIDTYAREFRQWEDNQTPK